MESRRETWMAALLLAVLFGEGASIQDSSDPLEFVLLEEQPAGTSLGNIFIASGLQRQFNSSVLGQLRLSFLTQPYPDRPYFSVEERTGILRTTREVDREDVCRPTFPDTPCLLAFDLALQPTQFFRILKVKVEVLDINDHVPTFPERKFIHVLSESAEVGTGFTIPPAVDWDTGKFGVKRYDVKPKSSLFELRTSTSLNSGAMLRLVLKEKLDRERESSHQVIVYAVDGGHPALTGSMTIQVQVGDANDNRPTFEGSTYEVTVSEDVAPGSVFLKVKATDLDIGPNGEVYYELAEGTADEYGDVFGIDSTSGEIFVQGKLDHESHPVYHLFILAFDRGPDSIPGQASILVRLTDVNDNPPEVEVSFLTSSGRAEVMENSPIGTFVAFISVSDPDSGKNGEFECHVTSGDEFVLEQIYNTQFKVVTAVTFDREFQTTAPLEFQCEDLGVEPLTSGMKVKVEILDENDNQPEFPVDSYHTSVIENNEIGLVLLTVEAFDKDLGNNSLLTYHLDDSVSKFIHIEPETGNIRAISVLEHEMSPAFEFWVLAVDGGVPARTGTASVLIEVIDVDDEWPRFESESYTFEIYENEATGSEVGKVVARDSDSPPFDQFFYVMETNSQDIVNFRVDSLTGKISTREILDCESQSIYRLIIAAHPVTPAATQSTSSVVSLPKTQVTIRVIDVNENAPYFIVPDPSGNASIQVFSHAHLGHVILEPEVEDGDCTGSNALRFSFSISDVNGTSVDSLFQVDMETGSVAIDGDLEPLSETEVVLLLTVADTGYPVLRSSIYFRVIILKDETPVSFFTRLISGDSVTTAIAVVIGLTSVILALVLVIVVLCIAKRNRRNRKRKERTGKSRSSPPDIVCCQLDEGATPNDHLMTGRPIRDMVHLQVVVASPDVNGKQTILTETVTSLDSPGNDSGRGSCEEYIDQPQREQLKTDKTQRSKEPLVLSSKTIARFCHHDVMVDETSARGHNDNSPSALDQEQSYTTKNGLMTTRFPDRLSRFLGARPTQGVEDQPGIQLQPLLSHGSLCEQDSHAELSSDTWRMNENTSEAFCRTDALRGSSSSRDERVAAISLKAGKYFMYEPVDGGL